MGIETDTLDDYFSHPALCRGDYASLYGREKDQLCEPLVPLDMKLSTTSHRESAGFFGVPVSDRQVD
jgi:hypothetical protein